MRIALIIFILLLSGIAQADEFIIPWSCYPKELQAEFMNRGLVLDLDGNDRTRKSWGFLRNEGAQYIIYTYKPATEEEKLIIRQIVLE